MAPRVLIADKLSPAAIDIFKARGVEADVKTGLTKDQLLEIIVVEFRQPGFVAADDGPGYLLFISDHLVNALLQRA